MYHSVGCVVLHSVAFGARLLWEIWTIKRSGFVHCYLCATIAVLYNTNLLAFEGEFYHCVPCNDWHWSENQNAFFWYCGHDDANNHICNPCDVHSYSAWTGKLLRQVCTSDDRRFHAESENEKVQWTSVNSDLHQNQTKLVVLILIIYYVFLYKNIWFICIFKTGSSPILDKICYFHIL